MNNKKGGLSKANLVNQEDICQPCASPDFDISKIDTYLDNLAAATTQEKDILAQLVTNNINLVKQLELLTSKVQ